MHSFFNFYLSFLILLFITIISAQNPSSSSSSETISRFQEYLRINTAQPNPNYYEATNFILSQAKSLSLESQVIEFVKNKPLILLKWPGKNPILPSVLLNSHTDVVPVESHKWVHPPFAAHIDSHGNIYARGSQDMKSVGLQYLEAIRKLKDSGFEPTRSIYLSFVPDEEIGGQDGAEKLAESDVFKKMNIAFVLDEGMPSTDEIYRAYYAERSPTWLVIKATGAPGHGAKLYDNTAMENLLKSIESIRRYRASEFDMVKNGMKTGGEAVSVNMVYLKAGTQIPTGFVMNLQPSEAEAGIDIRVPPTADQSALEKRIAEEWAPASRNMTFEFKQKVPVLDKFGKPAVTVADSSNPWWTLLEEAVLNAGGKLEKPEIFFGCTDARFFRQQGLPAIGFSAIANTPLLLHDHNEVEHLWDEMTSSEPPIRMASFKSLETSNDLISNMPAIVTDKILKRLPLSIAAKTSILSRTWRRIWLSCHYLVFDGAFWKGFCKLDSSFDWQKGSSIINNILFHQSAHIHSFYLELRPKNAELLDEKYASLSQWLSLLSRTCPKKIALLNSATEWSSLLCMPSYIFHCTELVKLKLQCFVLNAPPFDFKGFPHLRSLELFCMRFNNGIDTLWSLIAKCPCLVLLRLENCLGIDIIDIDAPRLETLIIRGSFDSLRLENAPRLIDVSLCSIKTSMSNIETAVATINSLANSYELECLEIGGNLSKFLAAGGMTKSLPVAFNHLRRLCLTKLQLSDSDVFCFSLGMVQRCPFIKDLEIIIISASNVVQHKYECCSDKTDNYELGRLQKVKITGITGSSAELKLIEYVLAISPVLEKLFFKCIKLDAASELKVFRQLIQLPRASTKARLVCLEK